MFYDDNPRLAACKNDIEKAISVLAGCFGRGGKLLVCGNGGSSADSDHIVGELMKGFRSKRPVGAEMKERLIESGLTESEAEKLEGALPAVSLSSQTALFTAYCNDAEPDMAYAQAVYGYGKKGDTLLCISTSGNSKNTVLAAKTANALGLETIALTGKNESALSRVCGVTVRVPETETYKVQELHLPVYHYICARIEEIFFK